MKHQLHIIFTLVVVSTLGISAIAADSQAIEIPNQPKTQTRPLLITDPSATAFPGETLRGGWAIGYGADFSHISSKDVQTPRWFLISEYGSDPGTSVELVIDGVSSNFPVNFGGSALVWGKSVYIKKYLGTGKTFGAWGVIDPAKVNQPSVIWSIFPETNKESILGMFDVPREFMVSFGQDLRVGDCTDGALTPIVDGKTVSDATGAKVVLAQGASLIVRGKTIRVTVTGSCRAGIGFSGALQLL